MSDAEPKKRKLTLEQRRSLREAELARFVRQYARKAQRGEGANDRNYDRDVQYRIKRLKPSELDELLRENSVDD